MSTGAARATVTVRSVNCPNCGAATAVRTFGHAVNVVCQSCRSILDAQDAGVAILQQFKDAVPIEPLIPLGSRGQIREVPYEVVGFQVRQIIVDHVAYRWREYLLFNPYREFRYLTEYAGHWNLVSTLRALPEGDHLPGNSRIENSQRCDLSPFPVGYGDARCSSSANFRGRSASATKPLRSITSRRRACFRQR